MVNNHVYGNGVSIFTREGDAARNFVQRVQAGRGVVERPEGVRRDRVAGLDLDGPLDALHEDEGHGPREREPQHLGGLGPVALLGRLVALGALVGEALELGLVQRPGRELAERDADATLRLGLVRVDAVRPAARAALVIPLGLDVRLVLEVAVGARRPGHEVDRARQQPDLGPLHAVLRAAARSADLDELDRRAQRHRRDRQEARPRVEVPRHAGPARR